MKRAQSDPEATMVAKRRRSDSPARSARSYSQPGKSGLSAADASASTSSPSTARCSEYESQQSNHLLPFRPSSRQRNKSSIQGERRKVSRQPTPARQLATQPQGTIRDPRAFQDLAAAALRIVEQHFALPHVQTRPRRQQVPERQERRQKRNVSYCDHDEPGWHFEELAAGDTYSDEDNEDEYEAEPGVVYDSRETELGYTTPVIVELHDDSDEDKRETPVEDRAAWLRAVR